MKWIRTCQECGHEQECPRPDTSKPLTDAYRNRKCKKCKSAGLDYGMSVQSLRKDNDGNNTTE